MSKIHPMAMIEEGAKLGQDVTIEAFATIKKNVVLKDRVTVKSYAYIDGYTTIGEGSVIFPGASIGAKPQDLKFRGEQTFVEIGKNCEIREYATINSSCGEGSKVKVGDSCLIMAYCHIAHNCEVGNRVIMANSSQLAGHVIVENFAIIGGMTPVHQFVRIGSYAMVGGLSRISHDIPPYTIGGGIPYRLGGINLIGLKRHQFALETRSELAKAFKYIYREGRYLKEALDLIEKNLKPLDEIKHLVEFCKTSKRGLIGLGGIAKETEINENPEDQESKQENLFSEAMR